MNDTDLRSLALALPETEEKDHHGFPSFRVRGKIFATLPEPGWAHLMLGEDGIRAASAEYPAWCEDKWWGKRLAAVRADLHAADPAIIAELLTDAWRYRAPKAVLNAHPDLA